MALCVTHDVYFHPEIKEICYKCRELQDNCSHEKTHIDPLFKSRLFYGLQGEWEYCDNCYKLIKVG